MANNRKVKIPGELESVAAGGIVAAASAIYDESKGMKQSDLNSEYSNALSNLATLSDFTSPTAESRKKIPSVGAILDYLNTL